ncbi:hypothetical protein B0O80DRAFT_11441 [Mortierella sp. GBAus27b]|nr:hypothetical protein B0O80DRAFT_11441 [Mortierella sp. GBAus27b]
MGCVQCTSIISTRLMSDLVFTCCAGRSSSDKDHHQSESQPEIQPRAPPTPGKGM